MRQQITGMLRQTPPVHILGRRANAARHGTQRLIDDARIRVWQHGEHHIKTFIDGVHGPIQGQQFQANQRIQRLKLREQRPH